MLKKKSFYFARHGESTHNQMGICAGGQIDSPLTEKGIQQAHKLKNTLREIDITHVVSSPLIRAKRTAEIAWANSPHIDENLKEFNLGVFEGKQDENVTEYIINLPDEIPVPNGESKDDFIARITNSFNFWLTTYEGTILFVAHGFVYGALLKILEKPISNSDGSPIDLDNASLIHFHHNRGRWDIKNI